FLSERHYVFHFGFGRRDAADGTGARDYRDRSGYRLRFSCRGDQLFARAVRRVFATRSEYLAARRARGFAANGVGIAATPHAAAERRGARAIFSRLGNVGGRADGKPPVVSGAVLFPFATQQSIVAGGANDNSGCVRAADFIWPGLAALAGETDIRDFAPRRGGSGASVELPAEAHGRRALASRRVAKIA